MTTFALVHGAFHGAWCWDLLVPELVARGHAAVAPELPCEDPDAGLDRYADVVVEALHGTGDDVVVVGHSLGCMTAPVVAERRPVAGVVYLAGPVPEPGRTVREALEFLGPAEPGLIGSAAVVHDDGTHSLPAEVAVEVFFHDCDPELAAWAAGRLRRQSWRPMAEPSPARGVPDAPAAYLVCREDRTFSPDRQRRLARERVGVEPVELAGGHSPFLARPADLADALAGFAAGAGRPT